MREPTLAYEQPSSLSPLPALRRIWWLGVAWSALVLFTSATTFVSWIVMPGGGLDVYTAIPYWWADAHRPASGLIVGTACVIWYRHGLEQRSTLAATLAFAAACLLFVPLAIMWNDPVYPRSTLLAQALRCMQLASVPLALSWAAISPGRFMLSRLAGFVAVAIALAAAEYALAVIYLHESRHFTTHAFWETLLSRGWFVGTVMRVAIMAAAAIAFGVAAFRFRRGHGTRPAMAGSWMLVGLAVLLQTTIYGLWWSAWDLSIPQQILRHVDSFAAILLSFCIGLAFLLPIRDSQRLATQ